MADPALTPFLAPEAGGALNQSIWQTNPNVAFLAAMRDRGLFGAMALKEQAGLDQQKMQQMNNVLQSLPTDTAPADRMRRQGELFIRSGMIPQGKSLLEAANALQPHETYGAPTTVMQNGQPVLAMPGNQGNMRVVKGASPYERGDEAELGRILDQAGIKDEALRQPIFKALASKKTTHQPAAITNVNTFTPASEEAQKEFMKSTRTNYEALRSAPVTLKNIEEAKALIPQAKGFMGPGGESLLAAASFLNNRLGMSVATEGVKNAEEIRSRIFFQIMDNLKKMDAQPSQMQQKVMMDALGNLGTDPNALPAVLDAFASSIRGKVDIHNKEIQGAVSRGVKFPYDPVIKFDAPAGTPSTPKTYPQPSPAAINRLKMNPAEKAMFESIFGPGSAGKFGGR